MRESSSKIKLFKNFKEKKSFKPEFGVDGIYGGALLGVRAANSLSFYDWESQELLRRIEIQVKHVCLWYLVWSMCHVPHLQVMWSDSSELVCVAAEDSYYILQYKADAVVEALANNEGIDEDGIEAAFDVVGEIEETVKTGMWVGDCFIYTNSVNRLNYYVGGEIVTISHLDRRVWLAPADSA